MRRAKYIALHILNNEPISESETESDSSNILSDDDVANNANDEIIEEDNETDGEIMNECDGDSSEFEEENLYYLSSSEEESDDEGYHVLQEENLISADGTVWSKNSPNAGNIGREHAANIFTAKEGFRKGLNPVSRLESFFVFAEDIINSAFHYTRLETRRINARRSTNKIKPISSEEFNTFIGLHFLSGAYKATHRRCSELWSECDGHPIFRASMSYERFKQIKSLLRFDDKCKRNPDDKLCLVRSLIEMFNQKMLECYTPSSSLTIDEQLMEFHGRVKFKRYVPSKPGKYGILFYWISDNRNTFPLRCIVYSGQKSIPEKYFDLANSVPEALSIYLSEPFLEKGRNISMDNYFTSLSLARYLLQHKTTLVGTIRSNKREVPKAALSIQNRTKGDTALLS